MLSGNLTPEQIQAIVVWFILWLIMFVIAPARALKAGFLIDDPPLSLKLRPFKVFRMLALLAMLGTGYAMPLEIDLLTLDYPGMVPRILSGDLAGPALAIGLMLIFFWAVPEMTARGRLRRDEVPGEWLTPALVMFRWFWFGVVLMAVIGIPQAIDVFWDLLYLPLNMTAGIALPLAGMLFYLLWWGLPGMKVSRDADDADPHAIASQSIVRWRGLPAFIGYLAGRRTRGDKVKGRDSEKLCPSCMRPIDHIEDYEGLLFDVCPHCSEVIPPVFKMSDYIVHLAERIAELANRAAAKKRRGERQSKKETDLVQRMLRATLTLAVRERGTDLHLLSESGNCLVRCRTDGVLFTLLQLPETVLRPLISAIKVQSNIDISERRKPQDGSFKSMVDDIKLDVRVNTSPTSMGETASLRLLYRQAVLGALEKLGINHRNFVMFTDLINRPHGLILVTGPTGSGKSTTLYNALGSIANGERNIITLEDPIEFKIEGLTQMQVNASKGFSFASGLRSILRQDPDVIMVGEIRDGETAKMAIDAAMTGHLVFSSLHTIDTTSSIGRLLDLGVDPHRHSDALLLVVAQRLVRLNCPDCSAELVMPKAQLEALGLTNAPEKMITKRGEGCATCHHSGYFDREGIYELFTPNQPIRQLIAKQASPAEIRREARSQGMRTLLEDGLTKVLLGRTTVEEVLRVTS